MTSPLLTKLRRYRRPRSVSTKRILSIIPSFVRIGTKEKFDAASFALIVVGGLGEVHEFSIDN
jgi:hypothetical protein